MKAKELIRELNEKAELDGVPVTKLIKELEKAQDVADKAFAAISNGGAKKAANLVSKAITTLTDAKDELRKIK